MELNDPPMTVITRNLSNIFLRLLLPSLLDGNAATSLVFYIYVLVSAALSLPHRLVRPRRIDLGAHLNNASQE